MLLASYNINNVRERLPVLLAWLGVRQPDVVCLQELKSTEERYPHAELEAAGYRSLVVGQGAWNGVAILSRSGEPQLVRKTLPGDASDRQARYLEAAVSGMLVACLYAPNGNPRPGPKFDYKLAWTDRLIAHAAGLIDTGLPVALIGDFNIVPEPRDIYATTSYDDNALVQPEARERYARLLAQGWTDVLRAVHPDETIYTFWDYRRNRWQRNAGLRIDHFLLSGGMAERLLDAGVDREVRGLPGASDHAPVWMELE